MMYDGKKNFFSEWQLWQKYLSRRRNHQVCIHEKDGLCFLTGVFTVSIAIWVAFLYPTTTASTSIALFFQLFFATRNQNSSEKPFLSPGYHVGGFLAHGNLSDQRTLSTHGYERSIVHVVVPNHRFHVEPDKKECLILARFSAEVRTYRLSNGIWWTDQLNRKLERRKRKKRVPPS